MLYATIWKFTIGPVVIIPNTIGDFFTLIGDNQHVQLVCIVSALSGLTLGITANIVQRMK